MTPSVATAASLAVFGFTYAGLAIGKVPLLALDRAAIALVGGTATLVLGLVDFDHAVAAVDHRTIALLFGMMLVVAYLRLGGLFERASAWLFARVRSPIGLLAAVVGLAGVLSAFLVNDVVCVALSPIVLRLARRIRRDPTPYFVALATAANVGSVATITGNPQNMIIGTLSGISYRAFAARLAPVAVVGLLVDFAVLTLAFRRALSREVGSADPGSGAQAGEVEARLLPKGLVVLVAAVVLFFAGAPTEVVALGAAAVLLVGRVRPDRLYGAIDWSLLVMFAGLFVVVEGFERHVVARWDLGALVGGASSSTATLTALAAGLSNLVSNVPAVLLLKPVTASLPPAAQGSAWLTLAMASTLSGNLTPVASVANLIVVESARREGCPVSLVDYCRVGVPVTVVTLAVGAAWLAWA